jgi:hypothetical protein
MTAFRCDVALHEGLVSCGGIGVEAKGGVKDTFRPCTCASFSHTTMTIAGWSRAQPRLHEITLPQLLPVPCIHIDSIVAFAGSAAILLNLKTN